MSTSVRNALNETNVEEPIEHQPTPADPSLAPFVRASIPAGWIDAYGTDTDPLGTVRRTERLAIPKHRFVVPIFPDVPGFHALQRKVRRIAWRCQEAVESLHDAAFSDPLWIHRYNTGLAIEMAEFEAVVGQIMIQCHVLSVDPDIHIPEILSVMFRHSTPHLKIRRKLKLRHIYEAFQDIQSLVPDDPEAPYGGDFTHMWWTWPGKFEDDPPSFVPLWWFDNSLDYTDQVMIPREELFSAVLNGQKTLAHAGDVDHIIKGVLDERNRFAKEFGLPQRRAPDIELNSVR
ncbi:hypothetical protein BXZ70DRAFT_1011241 [Cristinia sonorae]|uniref:Uncharacterized protein n=1 Tax=Cristinia sonorae TaxID=1940300 RepID=A0A8K0UHH0_9AGAR|nr:hypothetical protein BXZ70DRAFT_1012055 [Cristinia sonorae]KAH8091437.1 hypothetical protein BXZ70DRAFT_1011241 [Cristinia sonorae]